ncbi:putative disease resistance protein At1g50180 [Setaria italica]|uniref:putative disease resistance protein At1g50180 n=1 Tax=Setaria italica TaxID=4555 RepID=UPI0006455146|nr:putative disease resistance protein At1g50180 [Setaria italica]
MAQEEVSMLLGVSGEIEKLEENMEGINKAFLADAERRRVTDQSVQRWVRKLKDAMYDATDIIDEYQLEADKRRGSTEDGSSVKKKKVSAGCFQPLLFCLGNPVFAHKIGSRIKELNQRLDGIHKLGSRQVQVQYQPRFQPGGEDAN